MYMYMYMYIYIICIYNIYIYTPITILYMWHGLWLYEFILTFPGSHAAEPHGRGADSAGTALGQGSWRQPRCQGPPVALRMDAAGHLLPAGGEEKKSPWCVEVETSPTQDVVKWIEWCWKNSDVYSGFYHRTKHMMISMISPKKEPAWLVDISIS